ncbi:MAG TPA: protein kinase [Vicinamibacterales bacterium]|nr:protein kinase [Vicinamibacterales bacterium]
MALTAGTRLGPYEILGLIGAGGMGEVYQARDTRLDRSVAIKILAPGLSADADLRARFEREARTIAALNHPHICTLHDVGEREGSTFLVMEHLAGETLAARLEKGPLPLEVVLSVATEIADALSAAHRQGVVHRDLKPGNVMLTRAGIKLLDFGLAKLRQAQPAVAGLSAAPTRTTPLTGTGSIVGTLHYMSPEQLEGREADARSDLFAFGAIVYEMATGRRAFEGNSQASLIAAIIDRDPPPVSTLQPLAPRALDRLVRRCLAKEPEERWQTAKDLIEELKWIAESGGVQAEAAREPRRSRRRHLVLAVTAVLGTVAGAVAGWIFTRASAQHALPVQRWAVALPSGHFLGRGGAGRLLAVSPDGQHLVYGVGTGEASRLYHRPLDRLDAVVLPGTDGAAHPFFSPDGEWVGFIAGDRLKRVSLAGGTPISVCNVAGPVRGATWTARDAIIFASGSGNLMAVPSAGGTPRVIMAPDQAQGEYAYRWPQALPGGRAVLVTVTPRVSANGKLMAVVLEEGTGHVLAEGVSSPMYTASGHLLFVRESSVFAAPFDVERLELRGEPVPVLEGVLTFSAGAANYDVSRDGSLVYLPGELGVTLAWVDQHGRAEPIRSGRWFGTPQVSPDGRRAAVDMTNDEGGSDIWVYDVARNGFTRFTTGAANHDSRWSPDGRWIVFSSNRDGEFDLYRKRTDFSGEAERLLKKEGRQTPEGFSPDGEFLIYSETGSAGKSDLWRLPIRTGATPVPLFETPFSESHASVSPDGRWLAYVSDESGRDEVYVRALAERGGRLQVSTEGGVRPAWSRTGQRLFFFSPTRLTYGQREMLVSEVTTGPELRFGTPRRMFEGAYGVGVAEYAYTGFSIDAGSGRFLMLIPSSDQAAALSRLVVVTNWFEELRAKVPVK